MPTCTKAPPFSDDADDDRKGVDHSRRTVPAHGPSRPWLRPGHRRHTTPMAGDSSRPADCRSVQLTLARVAIAKFVRRQANETAAAVGFDWLPTPDAPSTYQQLRGAYAASLATGRPLPVSNLHTDTSVFLNPEDNIAFRFWHDVHHVRLGLSFSLSDELELASWHLGQAEQAGFAPGSLAYRLLEADHVGQVLLQGLAGRFPFDQETFVLTCVEAGLSTGLLAELRRVPGVTDRSQAVVGAGGVVSARRWDRPTTSSNSAGKSPKPNNYPPTAP